MPTQLAALIEDFTFFMIPALRFEKVICRRDLSLMKAISIFRPTCQKRRARDYTFFLAAFVVFVVFEFVLLLPRSFVSIGILSHCCVDWIKWSSCER
ncbi:MAG: hypothetical protein AUG51_24660 [Acidobacteria bacterium 13_1_20CM_3_53_8]|nr:MAG: hypothetical protein AUG51_24660 [Acidobacteria bacterium 13_1_20CM_3_53_8]